MTKVDFTICFHSPFRVGAAYPSDGIDAGTHAADPLPADTLKGVMRAAASDLLGHRGQLVQDVFGTTATPSPWTWTGATLADGETWAASLRHRVAIDPDDLAALREHLALGEQLWAAQAGFAIERVRYLKPADEDRHLAMLKVSAGAVHGLGAWRRRGLGWVQIAPAQGPVTARDVQLVLSTPDSQNIAAGASAGQAGGER